ncbi:MAG: type III-B CRISPR module-associated protein Cmr5 [Syntrophus sp. (in: bacteria)]|nr:type III-B CRISPR module-associated protein Cmr5 [Syntrophus sp. (in: bacteria)]
MDSSGLAGGGVMQQTLSQQRAARSLELLDKIKEKGRDREPFSQFCKSFPTMVLKNGLGQSLAFIKSKPDKKYENMYATLNAWLIKMGLVAEDTFREIHTMDSRKYMQTQTEAIRFLEWIKRYENAGIFGQRGTDVHTIT